MSHIATVLAPGRAAASRARRAGAGQGTEPERTARSAARETVTPTKRSCHAGRERRPGSDAAALALRLPGCCATGASCCST